MRITGTLVYNVLVGLSFLISGAAIYYFLGLALFGVGMVGFSDPNWPNGYEHVYLVEWWLSMMTVIWFVALIFACIEMRRKNRKKWLASWAILPIVGAAVIFGVSLVAIRYVTPQQTEHQTGDP